MNLRDCLRTNFAAGLVGSLGAACLGVFFAISPFGHSLVHLSYDIPFLLRSDIKVDGAVIVYMDEESRRLLGQPTQGPWDRSLHVRLLDELGARGAKAVVFDVLFDQPSTNRALDEVFAMAIRSHGRVVLAASAQYYVTEGKPSRLSIIRAVDPIGSAAPWGIVELPQEVDGAIRQQYSDPNYTNLAWQAAASIGRAPPNRPASRWMNYYAAQGAIPQVSYFQVLEKEALPAQFFADKVIFVGLGPIIGYQGGRKTDEFRTPYTRWTGFMSPGVEIHATAFLNLVRGDWLSRLSPVVELELIVVSGALFGFGLACLRLRNALVSGLLAVLAIPLLASILTWRTHVWLPWAVVPGVQIPLALGWAALVRVRQRLAPPALSEQGVENLPPTRIGTTPTSPAPARSEHAVEKAEPSPTIPDHNLLRCIGEGSYGRVWLARNVLGTYRAVKVVYRRHFEYDGPYDREFSGINKFEPISRSHEGFVDILQVGRNDQAGFFYYVMEIADDHLLGQHINPDNYLPKSLAKEVAKRKRLPVKECLQIGLCLTEALHRLHEKGLVHRDIKPSNIVYVEGIPKLADIGLVADVREARSFVGTEGFIPPEGPGTPQADLYSLGKVLYELGMGMDRRYFPELPASLGEDPEYEMLLGLNEVILKACATSPHRRYHSAQRMHEDLLRLLNKRVSGRAKKPKGD